MKHDHKAYPDFCVICNPLEEKTFAHPHPELGIQQRATALWDYWGWPMIAAIIAGTLVGVLSWAIQGL